MRIIKDCERSETVYLEIGKISLIFRHGKYHGWYHPLLDRVV